MRIFQLLSTIAYGDAVSNDTVAMEKAIKQMGYQTRIYAESIVPPLDKKTALAISELKDVSNDDIIIFHMSTGSRLNFDVAKYPCRKIVVYHNITPPEYFKNNDERFSDICEYGLKGAKSLADKVDYCLAVSEFNKKDLLNMGYKCPIDVLPIIIPMSDYDKAPDKSVVKKYSDDYVNILFTGHIKFDQILAYYKTADVFLCMSEHEGFCVPIVEAMKFKVPIIAYGRAAVPETMNHKGMILDDNNPQYVAACIDKMVKDKKLRDYVIEEQNERLEYYSYDNISAMFKEYLSKFIDKKD